MHLLNSASAAVLNTKVYFGSLLASFLMTLNGPGKIVRTENWPPDMLPTPGLDRRTSGEKLSRIKE